MMKNVTVFVDESGNQDLDFSKHGTSRYYVIAGVVVLSENLLNFENSYVELFGLGEKKFSKIRNYDRRYKRLQAIGNLDFMYTTLIVDKNSIFKDSGLSFKNSFYKFLAKSFYKRLRRLYGNIHIIADGYGSKEFMSECLKYHKNTVNYRMVGLVDLPGCHTFTVSYVDSASSQGVQVADSIAGALRRVHEGLDTHDMICPLADKLIYNDYWPFSETYAVADKSSDTVDELIRSFSVSSACKYIRENKLSDDVQIQICVRTIEFLLERFMHNSSAYTYGYQIKSYLETIHGYSSLQPQKFKSVIAKLRESGVAVVSKSSGYKIPSSFSDIGSFISKVRTTVHPYINRLGLLRNMLYAASFGKFDIFEDEQLKPIHRYLGD